MQTQRLTRRPILRKAKAKWSTMLPASQVTALLQHSSVTILDGELGDTATMGLSEETLQLLKSTVHIIIHAASAVNLGSSLREMSYTDMAPSLCLIRYALKFPNLERFVFVSTAYANAHLRKSNTSSDVPVEEKIYPLNGEKEDYYASAVQAWEQVQRTGSSDEYEAHDFPWPYGYGKHLSERLLLHKASEHDALDKLLIIRPSLIGPAEEFPVPGFASPHSTSLTRLAAAHMLHPGRRITLATRCKDPHTESTIDEVPVDVVVDRLLVHTALGTAGCVHAVSGEKGRQSVEDWWRALNKERRLPWSLKLVWDSEDWHSPALHCSERIFKIFGASYAFSEEKSVEAVRKLDGIDGHGKMRLVLFRDSSSGPFSLASRRGHIYPVAVQMAKKKNWPACSVRLLCRKGKTAAA